MDVIHSQIDKNSKEFQENYAFHQKLRKELIQKLEKVRQGGGEKNVLRHHERGKFLPRERIFKILDEGSPFLELSTLAAEDVYETDVPSAGVVTGIGRVHGIECMFVANDATVKGGTYFPLSEKTFKGPGYCQRKPPPLHLSSRFRWSFSSYAR